jgi:hypothetical protein
MEFSGVFGLFGARSVLWAGEGELVWQEGADPPYPVDADALFSPVLGQPAGISELELLLFGLPVLWKRWPAGAEVRREGEGYRLAAHLADGASEFAWVAGDPPVLRELERRDGEGRVTMEARFDRHKTVQGFCVPGRVRIRAPDRGNRLRIDWERIEPDWPGAPDALVWPQLP